MKAIVCAWRMLPDPATNPPGREASSTNSVPTAMTMPTKKIPNHIRRVMMPSAFERGGLVIDRGSAGSTPRARAGAPSVTRLIHSS